MTLQERLTAAFQAVGADIKALFGRAVPAGGAANTVLKKNSATDYDDVWGSVGWGEITSKPSTFPPSSHNHVISDVTNLQTSLDAKAPSTAGQPTGGTAGQVLTKTSGTDYASGWAAIPVDPSVAFAGSFGGGVVTGDYYDTNIRGTGYGTVALTAGQVKLGPYLVGRTLAIDRIGFEVTTAQSSGTDTYYVGIYTAGTNGWPATRVFLSSAITGTTTTGLKEVTASFTFSPGVLYYVGVHSGGNATVRLNNALGSQSLGKQAATGTSPYFTIVRTLAIGTPMPTTWTFVASERNIAQPVHTLFRAA